MLKINFYPDSDYKDFSVAIKEYQKIWDEDGERIVEVWEKLTGFKFVESWINAIVSNHISRSYPLNLRYNIPFENKKATLIHELGHRILLGRQVDFVAGVLEIHKRLYLVLYDVFVELYGKDFADMAVEWDKNLNDSYKEAWEYALQFNKEERRREFKKFLV